AFSPRVPRTLIAYSSLFFLLPTPPPPSPTLFPYTTLFRSKCFACLRPSPCESQSHSSGGPPCTTQFRTVPPSRAPPPVLHKIPRSEEHTSELQSPYDLVCRLLLEKKKGKAQHAQNSAGRPS